MNSIHCALEGRIGKDAELRHVKGGDLPMVSLAVAVDSGKEEGEATWVKVALFGNEAEELAPRLVKGARVYIEGRISLNTWQDREGNSHSGLQVTAWTIQPLGQIGRKKPGKPRKPRQQGDQWRPSLGDIPSEAELNDQIPF